MSDLSRIPILDLAPELAEVGPDLEAAFKRVVASGHFILGPEVEAFEREVASYLGVKHAIGVNSGTDAIVIGLRALGIGPGDEVITSPFTFFATPEGVSAVGATPVFVDIDPETFNLRPDLVARAVTPRTKAILPVHLFGHAADMGPLVDLAHTHGLAILEDVAQAFGGEWHGRKLGTIGNAGAYSFFPSKNLGCLGDGGLVTTGDDRIAEACRMLRAHGSKRKYENEQIGYNSRLDALQAAFLRAKLPHIDDWNAGRARAAARYRELLAGVPGLVLPVERRHVRHVYHQFTLRVLDGQRDALRAALSRSGIETMVYYPTPCHRLPVYDGYGEFPACARSSLEVLSLPVGWRLAPGTHERVASAIHDWARAISRPPPPIGLHEAQPTTQWHR